MAGGRTNRIEKINGESFGWPDNMPVLPPAFARAARLASGHALPEDYKPLQTVSDQSKMVKGLAGENESLRNGLYEIRAQYERLTERLNEESRAPVSDLIVTKQAEEIETLKATNNELMERMSQLATAMEALMARETPKKK
ncbi:MAG: hypothetical protein V1897_17260 [Pseudomonadota bacterium]